MSKVFIIAEAACTWLHGGLEAAYRSIQAAKACGADAWKTQFTSDPEAMAMRRGVARDKYTRLGWGVDALPLLKAECDRVGIEFMVTTFIEKDVALISPYVGRFKVAAFESGWDRFREVNRSVAGPRQVIVSVNPEDLQYPWYGGHNFSWLHCVSKYPTPVDSIKLSFLQEVSGLSDHTTSVLTGAVAVGAGARIIEKHVRLSDTPESDPDYGHSLICEDVPKVYASVQSPNEYLEASGVWNPFKTYVDNIREAERML